MTVSQLLDNTTSYELGEWMAELKLEHDERTEEKEQQTVESDLKKVFGKRE